MELIPVLDAGEELSKKQAAVEGQMRKLRGTIRELEMERDRLVSRLQASRTLAYLKVASRRNAQSGWVKHASSSPGASPTRAD